MQLDKFKAKVPNECSLRGGMKDVQIARHNYSGVAGWRGRVNFNRADFTVSPISYIFPPTTPVDFPPFASITDLIFELFLIP